MKLGCPNTLGILKNVDPNQTARMHIVLGLRCLYLTRDAFSKNYTCFRKKITSVKFCHLSYCS